MKKIKIFLGSIVLFVFLPIIAIIALIEPTILGEIGVWYILSTLGVASSAGWLLSKFRK